MSVSALVRSTNKIEMKPLCEKGQQIPPTNKPKNKK